MSVCDALSIERVVGCATATVPIKHYACNSFKSNKHGHVRLAKLLFKYLTRAELAEAGVNETLVELALAMRHNQGMDKAMKKKLVVYGTPICPMVPPVRSLLGRTDIEYDYVDISRDADAKEIVRGINNGNESVPTLVFPDGQTMTEPSSRALRAKLEADGHTVAEQTLGGQVTTVLQTPTIAIVSCIVLAAGIFGAGTGYTIAGGIGLAVFLLNRAFIAK